VRKREWIRIFLRLNEIKPTKEDDDREILKEVKRLVKDKEKRRLVIFLPGGDNALAKWIKAILFDAGYIQLYVTYYKRGDRIKVGYRITYIEKRFKKLNDRAIKELKRIIELREKEKLGGKVIDYFRVYVSREAVLSP